MCAMSRPRPPQSFLEALKMPYRSDRSWLYDLDEDVGTVESSRSELRAKLARQRMRTTDLSHVVAMLVRMLDEAGVVKTADLHARIEVELAAIAAERAKTPGPDDARCDRCDALVPKARTTITANGTLCDRCFEGT
jgi:formylmethanofuran dehydrogenase subunit E